MPSPSMRKCRAARWQVAYFKSLQAGGCANRTISSPRGLAGTVIGGIPVFAADTSANPPEVPTKTVISTTRTEGVRREPRVQLETAAGGTRAPPAAAPRRTQFRDAAVSLRAAAIAAGERVVQAELSRVIARPRSAQHAMQAFAERRAELD